MANKMTVALTRKQYEEIIRTMHEGGAGFRKNPRIATALVLEANLGLRIEDILELRLKDIIRDGSRYRLDIHEQKTGKKRTFTVPAEIYMYIENYCLKNKVRPQDRIFPIKERGIQKYLQKVADYLGYENIGTHSFRKYYATDIYNQNGHDIALVQILLQHTSAATTQRYINISPEKVEDAIRGHIDLI
jgi:integrase